MREHNKCYFLKGVNKLAIFKNMVITDKGKDLYNKVQTGIKLEFTKMAIGSGQLNDTDNPEIFTELKEHKFDVDISSVTTNTQLQVAIVNGTINNTNITEGQYICELGLYAKDPDLGEILYGYTNAGTQGDYIAPNSSGAFAWNYQVNAAVGNAETVTATVSSTTFDYAVASSSSTFAVISGTNQKEINESIDKTISLIKNTVNFVSGSFTASTDNTSSFLILVPYNPSTDHIELFYHGNTRMQEGINYTKEGTQINLNDWSLNSGETITYNVWQFVNNVPIMADGKNLQDNSVAKRSLTEDVQNTLDEVPELSSQMAENVTYSENSNKLYNTKNKLQLKQTVKGVAFGDSLTYSQDGNTGNQASSTYPQILQAKLGKTYGYSDISIINAGTQGQTSTFALANVDSQVIEQNPDFCIMMWGTNDCNQNIDLNTFKDNLRQVIKKLIKSNIEVILLSPPPNFHAENDRTHRQQLYSKIVYELAKELDVCFIDMYLEIFNIINDEIETPISIMPDKTHFAGDKYFYLADIIISKALLINSLEIKKEISIPVWHSPYILTDIPESAEFDTPISQYTKLLKMTKDGTMGTYLRFIFFNKLNNVDLIAINNRGIRSGTIKVIDNGAEAETVNFYSGADASIDVPSTVIRNLNYGLHVVEFLIENIELGKSTVGDIHFGGFQLKLHSKFSIKNIVGNDTDITNYQKLIDATIEFQDLDTIKEKHFICNQFVELQQDKILAIKCKGKFYDGFGFTWFVNPTYIQGQSGNYSGYMVSIINGAVKLHHCIGDVYSIIASSDAITIDYSIENEYKILHSKDGTIKFYLNGTLILEFQDTAESAGKCGLYSTIAGTGTALINNFEFAYI
jgi:lysophospholipase L1-like esterase